MFDAPRQACRYALTPGLLVKSWGEGTGVAYAPASASTHLVSADAVTVLLDTMALADGIGLVALSASLDVANPSTELLDRLHDLLEGLVHAGILQRID